MSSWLSHLIFLDLLVYLHVLVSCNDDFIELHLMVVKLFTCPTSLGGGRGQTFNSFQFISDVLFSNVRWDTSPR